MTRNANPASKQEKDRCKQMPLDTCTV